MENMTVSQLMMEDINMVDEGGIVIADVFISDVILQKAAESSDYRLKTARMMYQRSTSGTRLIDGFKRVLRENPRYFAFRDGLVYYLGNCLLVLPNPVSCLNVEYVALESIKHRMIESRNMRKVVLWCRDHGCPELLPKMASFVFCKTMLARDLKPE